MNAKVMKEFVERKSGLITEYISANVSNNEAILTFSSTPLFISLVLKTFADEPMYSATISYSQTTASFLCPILGSVNNSYSVEFSGNIIKISSLYGMKMVEAVGFYSV